MERKIFTLISCLGILFLMGSFYCALDAGAETSITKKKKQKFIYPEKTVLEFEGLSLEGELKNPGEFYFTHRPPEKFDSLVKRRKNFHREMLRDVVLSK